jgi:uncharacterized protein YacL (UPF0231 family)
MPGSTQRLVQMEQNAIGRWMVHEVGDAQEMASFDQIEQCVDYAFELEKKHEAVVVQEEQPLH